MYKKAISHQNENQIVGFLIWACPSLAGRIAYAPTLLGSLRCAARCSLGPLRGLALRATAAHRSRRILSPGPAGHRAIFGSKWFAQSLRFFAEPFGVRLLPMCIKHIGFCYAKPHRSYIAHAGAYAVTMLGPSKSSSFCLVASGSTTA
jgi:hypothetical protein